MFTLIVGLGYASKQAYGGVVARWNPTRALQMDKPAIVSPFEVLIAFARNDQSFRFAEVCST